VINEFFANLVPKRGQANFVTLGRLSPHLQFKRDPLFHRQAVRLGDDRNHVYDLAELFHYYHIDGPKRVSRRVDEVQAAMDACILDVPVTHRGQLLAEVSAVLILDILDNGVPAVQQY
jgi:hypothetical protein